MAYIGVSPSNGVRRKHTYTATAAQTSFSGAGAENAVLSYNDSNFVDVYQNGVKLSEADYTSTSGTAIVLATGATVSDMIEVVVYDVFSVADTVSKSAGGTFDGAVTFAANIDATASGVTTATNLFTCAGGGTFSGPFNTISTNGELRFRDDAIKIQSSADGQLDIDADTEVEITTTTLDINGAVDMSSTLLVTGALSAKGGTVFNEDSADVDFRVESNGNANMLVIDGGDDVISIGAAKDAGATVKIQNKDDSNTNTLDLFNDNGNRTVTMQQDSAGNAKMRFQKNDGTFTTTIDANLGGILFGTDTAAANTLDDYEEGTFSPVFQTGGNSNGISHSISSGTYTKVGNRVILNGFAVMSAKNSASLTGGNVTIGGIPFTIANDNNSYSAGAISLKNVSFADFPILSTIINTTTLDLREITNAGTQTNLTDGNLSATSYVIFNIAYRV